MLVGVLLALLGLSIGAIIGLNVPMVLPQVYAQYLGLGVLAALDSVFGGIRAAMENHYDNRIFVTGFFSNILLAAGLAYIGTKLGVPLSTAAVVAFGVRLFQNLAIIRRHLLKK
ncbi:small basic family protein [Desulforamulus hydrothermalis]|uniref:Small basic protein n=1 Tax=Desulforamulus hydrothermalis Lam5 = DSM 18033 TaxID=1121428 RepID=K8DZY0_9FIRM|nr:small basic family protein [Desulforamulus hydrothermalis]CCO08732.1 Small basic protein [Desulforamulus hydrothermalis Lam5 = DSM 18033]SHG70214.1 Small basic protein [Desulforamulus hydrothermalis Lam5 = DSM 18033]